jgi:hypothetical protein
MSSCRCDWFIICSILRRLCGVPRFCLRPGMFAYMSLANAVGSAGDEGEAVSISRRAEEGLRTRRRLVTDSRKGWDGMAHALDRRLLWIEVRWKSLETERTCPAVRRTMSVSVAASWAWEMRHCWLSLVCELGIDQLVSLIASTFRSSKLARESSVN